MAFLGSKVPTVISSSHTHAAPHVTHGIFRAEPTALQISPLTLPDPLARSHHIHSHALNHPSFLTHPFTLQPSMSPGWKKGSRV